MAQWHTGRSNSTAVRGLIGQILRTNGKQIKFEHYKLVWNLTSYLFLFLLIQKNLCNPFEFLDTCDPVGLVDGHRVNKLVGSVQLSDGLQGKHNLFLSKSLLNKLSDWVEGGGIQFESGSALVVSIWSKDTSDTNYWCSTHPCAFFCGLLGSLCADYLSTWEQWQRWWPRWWPRWWEWWWPWWWWQ